MKGRKEKRKKKPHISKKKKLKSKSKFIFVFIMRLNIFTVYLVGSSRGGGWLGRTCRLFCTTFLPIPLRRKFFTWLLHVQYLGSKKWLKSVWKWSHVLLSEGGSSRRERKKEEEDALVERHEREQYISEKGLKKIWPGPLTLVWELCCHCDVLRPWNLTDPGNFRALPPMVSAYRPSKLLFPQSPQGIPRAT